MRVGEVHPGACCCDKSKTPGDNVLAAAELRPVEKGCCPAVDGDDR